MPRIWKHPKKYVWLTNHLNINEWWNIVCHMCSICKKLGSSTYGILCCFHVLWLQFHKLRLGPWMVGLTKINVMPFASWQSSIFNKKKRGGKRERARQKVKENFKLDDRAKSVQLMKIHAQLRKVRASQFQANITSHSRLWIIGLHKNVLLVHYRSSNY